MQGTNRSGEGREEPAMWPRILVATRRESEKEGEDSKLINGMEKKNGKKPAKRIPGK